MEDSTTELRFRIVAQNGHSPEREIVTGLGSFSEKAPRLDKKKTRSGNR